MTEMNGTHALLTETDVSKQLRVSLAALRKWRVLNRGPKFVKLGPLVRYRQTDIEDWLATLPVGGGLHKEAVLAIDVPIANGTGPRSLRRVHSQ